jgi:hypothetical protein
LTVSDLFSSPLRVQLDGLPALIQVVLSNEPNMPLEATTCRKLLFLSLVFHSTANQKTFS